MGQSKHQKVSKDTNLLDCFPVTQVQSEENPSGNVVLLRPRFMKGPLAKWLQPRLKSPFVRITLDPIGSFVWRRCDGAHSVESILEDMKTSLKETDSDVPLKQPLKRLQMFLQQLVQSGMIRLDPL